MADFRSEIHNLAFKIIKTSLTIELSELNIETRKIEKTE